MAGAVEEPARADPPTAPAVGASYIVASGATGLWTGQDDSIAAFTPGGWRIIAPIDGLWRLGEVERRDRAYSNGGWSLVLSAPQAAISDAAGGVTIDAESRAAISAILGALRAHNLIAT